jgi:NAD+ synthase (glutamine-hydrolysing)
VITQLVQMHVRPGEPCENTRSMLAYVSAARSDGVDLIVFPEMAIPGYLLGDEWEREAFLRECETCTHKIREAARDITVVFGSVAVDWTKRNEDGRVRKYNACFIAEDGVFRGPHESPYPYVIKTLLPNYREFDDSRHFFDLRKLALELNLPLAQISGPVSAAGCRLGCALCEDAWSMDYAISPLDALAAQGADLLIDISASPFTLNKNHKRHRVFASHAQRLDRPLVYVNQVGVQNNGKTVFTFDGASCVYDTSGRYTPCTEPFMQGTLTVDLPIGDAHPAFGTRTGPADDTIADAYTAILYGTEQFMEQCGIERVVVGISGGIDSAVVAAIYRRILDPRNLLLVNMPSRHNSRTTRKLAGQLAANLGCPYAEIPIEDSVAVTERQLDGLRAVAPGNNFELTLTLNAAVRENIQARDRSSRLLAGIAAAFGAVFTCNANKSETTVGYTTLYGDLGGYLANIADLWKTEIYDLARHLNNVVFECNVIPQGCLDIMPSAELGPEQNIEKGKGDPLIYPYHDALFASWVERWNRATPEDVLDWYRAGRLEEEIGYSGRVDKLFPDRATFVADLERWWNLYQGLGTAKRIQAPPILAIKRRAFGFDHRESQMGPRYTSRYKDLKRELLA